MTPPFTEQQFLAVFAAYNEAIWPAQVVAYILAVVAVLLAFRPRPWSGPAIAAILALMWLWTGWQYHIVHFSAINPAARLFGAVFILQGLAFLATAALRPPVPRVRLDISGIAGTAMIVYAAIIYPLLGHQWGRAYPESPSFGVTPCPVTIFTFGLLLWWAGPARYLLVIPFLWSLVGFSAAAHLGVLEDFALPVAGVIGTVLALRRRP